MLREEKDTFLDDMTIAQLGERLGVKVEVLPVGGGDEAKPCSAPACIFREEEEHNERRNPL